MNAAVAALLFVCISTVASVAFAFIHGNLNHAIAVASLSLGAISALAYLLVRPRAEKTTRFGAIDYLLFVAFAFFALRGFCWLVFAKDDDVCVLSPNNLGDMALHLTYIDYLIRGATFWPENPIFSGIKLHYPLGADLFNALLVLIGVATFRSLIWVGLVGSLLTCYALYKWGGWFAIAAFLFNGGFAALKFFKTGHFQDYQDSVEWKSFPLALFVTQRGLLYAIPVGLLLLNSWRLRWFSQPADDSEKTLPFWIEVLFYSTMPLFHVHTFLFLTFLLGFWTVAFKRRLEVAKLIVASIAPATLLVANVTGLFERKSAYSAPLIHWQPGWMQADHNFFEFWWNNFGLFPVLGVALTIYMLWLVFFQKENAKAAAMFVIPSVLLFVVCCFVMFAPWDWDNTKLMLWCYLTVMPFIWEFLLKPLPTPSIVLSCALLFFSGFISLWGGLDKSHQGYSIAQRSEVDPIGHAIRSIPAGETFAAFPTYNHPLLLLGCKVVEGYSGHLMSHGIRYEERATKLHSLMLGEPGWQYIAHELGVHYLFWGRLEREAEEYAASTQPWKSRCKVVASGEWGTIYDLTSLVSPK